MKTANPQLTRASGFRRAVLRGLGVVLPPLLTIVVLIWAWNTIDGYVLRPIESRVRTAIVWATNTTFSEVPPGAEAVGSEPKLKRFRLEGTVYVPDPTGRRFLPEYVVKYVDEHIADSLDPFSPAPASANAYWHRYIQMSWMPRKFVVPVFLVVFLTVLYFLGRLFTFGIGRWFVRAFDSAILRIPIVNKVYGGVKQVTDFAFNEREIEFNRVVAIEYPRKGIWSLGFVTGNSMREISEFAGEPMLSVLMPTSPMPMTGFTVTVKKSEARDIDITIDEAIQFIVSCGVVIPPQQRNDTPAASSEAYLQVPPPAIAAPNEETSGPSATV